ncbi:venom allergen 5-like [Ctenocephalides felis]|uniref:venom allergen 5-like n=1 Tax=Ctenocephalides felis TaxID=7515 RepID=UPI000E6E183F|nr:venom allergen 5-like [Ctenocephalides felis]XP_026476548.1 venom allergen 5-like [Ctenocephalides felis]XP_026476769.1 venom allergen 5-like [Ctenocephalides felis]
MAARMFLVLLLVAVAAQARDYCQFKCYNGQVNFGCNHSGQPAGSCVGFKRMNLGAAEQKFVLDEHNNYRSIVAKGQAKNAAGQNLPAAKNMNELVWDDDLAHLAYLNVLQCKMSHDSCRDTGKYNNTHKKTQNGQNLFNSFTTASYSVEQVLKQGVKSWFDEVKDVQLSEINSFTGGNGKVIGHFTQVAWAKSTRVGCAVVTYKHQQFNSYLMACNYVNGNMLRSSIYEAGSNCAGCGSCTSRGLCQQ